MFDSLVGFAVGVVVGPTFTHQVWPKIVLVEEPQHAPGAPGATRLTCDVRPVPHR